MLPSTVLRMSSGTSAQGAELAVGEASCSPASWHAAAASTHGPEVLRGVRAGSQPGMWSVAASSTLALPSAGTQGRRPMLMRAQLLGMPCRYPLPPAAMLPLLACSQVAESATLGSWLWLNSPKGRLRGAASRAGDSGGDGGLEAGSYKLCATGAACREKEGEDDAEKELVLSTRLSTCTIAEAFFQVSREGGFFRAETLAAALEMADQGE